MWAQDRLVLIRVIEALDVVQVGNVQSCDVTGGGEGEVGVFSVFGDVGVDGGRVAGFGAEIVEQLRASRATVLVLTEGVNDPDLWLKSQLVGTDLLAGVGLTCPRCTAVAIAADSGFPGMNLTS